MSMTTENNTEWLAVINIAGYGAGSWARGPGHDDQIKRACRFFKQNFKHLFKLPRGTMVKVVMLDVTGRDNIRWDDSGFFDEDRKEPMNITEIVEARLP
jgi:hypothetical protein